MEQSKEQTVKGHTRTRSGVKATRPRSSTKGPLDASKAPLGLVTDQQPPQGQQPPQSMLSPPPRTPGAASPVMRSPSHSPAPIARRPAPPRPRDFSFLLRPEIYHPLPPHNIPPAFRNSLHNQPSTETPIPELVAQGHFRAAAIAAAQTLSGIGGPSPAQAQPDPTDHERIFDLFYTRLACLTLIDATSLAAQEVKALGDLSSTFYYQTISSPTDNPSVLADVEQGQPKPRPHAQQTQVHIVPWDLRVLAVRLQALGFGDPRRSIMSYYELAREARARLAEVSARHDHSAMELWKARLADLGLRVAGALVEMEDITGAICHLRSLPQNNDGTRAVREALLWLHLGDVENAKRCVGELVAPEDEHGVAIRVLQGLCQMADGEYDAALETWRGLSMLLPGDEMVGVNLAACLLYVGKMEEGKALLENLVDAGRTSHTLLFNLTTMYELSTDRAKALKVKLSEKIASLEHRDTKEKTNADFKL